MTLMNVSGLGVLNDVTITQSSAVWELHELVPDPGHSRHHLIAVLVVKAGCYNRVALSYGAAGVLHRVVVGLRQ
ncbi:hypothetical protein RKD54_001232 [Pseudarthrobacter sp. SLBN-100]|uniref:hypothetical protein n=1 Tax=Arthrobacter sp. SLBN-100 TaxID=2768450 RepID=UPI00135BD281|nr:hypothetical protein [Arthrobacter sp. SLBN-100]